MTTPRPTLPEEVEAIRARDAIDTAWTNKAPVTSAMLLTMAKQAIADRGTLLAHVERLTRERDDARELERRVFNHMQARFELVYFAWKRGDNDAVLEAVRKLVSVSESKEAVELNITTIEQLTDDLRRTRQRVSGIRDCLVNGEHEAAFAIADEITKEHLASIPETALDKEPSDE